MLKRRTFKFEKIVMIASVFFLMLSITIPASADMYMNYTNATGAKWNYSITSNTSKLPSFIDLKGGDIEMASVTLKVYINDVNLTSGSRYLLLSSGNFGPHTTSDFPKQKVYVVNSGRAIVNYSIKANSAFANYSVNISTYKQISSNVPFYSDLSVALLDFNDLKDKWSSNSIVLNELENTIGDSNLENLTTAILDSSGDKDGSLNLSAGDYLILVTNGTDPKQIITSTNVRVMPFNSIVTVPATGNIDSDVSVSVSLTDAPSENYTYISNIIKWEDYNSDIGNINISWTSGKTLVESVRINEIPLETANSLTDIIPRSNTTKNTTNSTSNTLILNTASLPGGTYLVHTVVYNSTNQTVAFNQSTITLETSTTPPSGGGSSGGTGGGGGGKSDENSTNIEVIEKYDLEISKGVLTSYRFKEPKNPIMFVNITGNASLGVVTATVEVLKSTSALMNVAPDGLIYKNANIWVGTMGMAVPKNIKEALIKFKVDNSWMSANSVTAKDIVLVKWDGSSWIQLETKVIYKDDANTYLEGKTNSFSPFAIAAKVAVAKPTVTKTPPPAGSPTPAATTPAPAEGSGIMTWLIGLIVLVIIGAAVYFLVVKKKE